MANILPAATKFTKSVHMLVGQSVHLPVGQSVHLPVGQSVYLPVGQSVCVPAGQSSVSVDNVASRHPGHSKEGRS